MRNFYYLFTLVFKQARKFKHFENNMTMFSSGMRKKYKKNRHEHLGLTWKGSTWQV